jgi:2'-5' RNA ligase
LRLFAALCIPPGWAAGLAAWQRSELAAHAPAARLVPQENLHVTLAFLDDRSRAEASVIAAALAEAVAASERGVEVPEHRPWLPHVTVLRYRVGRPRLEPALPELGPLVPSDAALYHSMLRSGGAQYDVVDSFALGGNH